MNSGKKLPLLIHLPKRQFRAGVTLVELLLAIVILLVLGGLSLAVISNVRSAAGATNCLMNMKKIGMATLQYADENRNRFPRIWSVSEPVLWNDQIGIYLGLPPYDPFKKHSRYWNLKVWWCPGTGILNNDLTNRHYALNKNVREAPWDYSRLNVPTPARIVLIGEINRNSDMFNSLANPVDHSGKQETNYRISHNSGAGANYIYCDGHGEYLTGVLKDQNFATSPWKWW